MVKGTEDLTFSITPNTGWSNENLTDNELPKGPKEEYTIEKVTRDHKIVASFKWGKHEAYTLTVTSSGPGHANADFFHDYTSYLKGDTVPIHYEGQKGYREDRYGVMSDPYYIGELNFITINNIIFRDYRDDSWSSTNGMFNVEIKGITTVHVNFRYTDVYIEENPDIPDPYSYIVLFDLHGIGGPPPASQSVLYGDKIIRPTDPEDENREWTFGGWYQTRERISKFFDIYELKDPWLFDEYRVPMDMVEQTNVNGTITLHAKWIKNITVTFDLNGVEGVAPQAQKIAPGTRATKPTPDPQADNLTFAGWYEEPECKNKWDPSKTISTSKTLYAKWTAKVKFDLQGIGGDKPADQTIIYKGKATEPTEPTSDTHDFGGWYTGTDYKTQWVFENDTVTEDMTLYAKWTEKTGKTHTVKFDLQNIGGDKPDDQIIDHGSLASEPEEPTSDTHDFGGWFKESSCTNAWDFDTDTVTEDITLYAKWTIKTGGETHTVKFDLQNIGSDKPDDQIIDHGSLASEPEEPKADTHDFGGWFKESNCTNAWAFDTDTVTEDITLYAKWTEKDDDPSDDDPSDDDPSDDDPSDDDPSDDDPSDDDPSDDDPSDDDPSDDDPSDDDPSDDNPETYTVKFDLQGIGSPQPADQTVEHGSRVTKPTDPTSDSHDFGGWYTGTDYKNKWDFENDTVTGPTTLYAKWTIKQYTVKFIGSGTTIPDQIVPHGGKVKKPTDPPSDSHTFDGWFKDAGCTEKWDFENDTVPAGIATEDRIIYLHAKQTIKSYTVHFDLQGVGGPKPKDQTVNHGSKVIKPSNPSAEGLTFDGWFEDKACTDAWDFDTDTVTDGITLYAKWTAKVSFDLQGIGGDKPADQTIIYKGKATEPTEPTSDSHDFGGWYTGTDYKTKWNFEKDTVTEDMTLYAKWTIKSYTVHFDLQGIGGPKPKDQTVKHGEKVSKPTDPSADGYTFRGWYMDKACTKDKFWDFSRYAVKTDLTLYAYWTKDPTIKDFKGMVVTPNGDGSTIKSGYGIGLEIMLDVETENTDDLKKLKVKARNSATKNEFELVFGTFDGVQKWVLPKNKESKIGARVDYLPVDLADGNYKFDIVVYFEGKSIATYVVRYEVEGVMYEDDFTGDR